MRCNGDVFADLLILFYFLSNEFGCKLLFNFFVILVKTGSVASQMVHDIIDCFSSVSILSRIQDAYPKVLIPKTVDFLYGTRFELFFYRLIFPIELFLHSCFAKPIRKSGIRYRKFRN
jgi:hypothetical protein